MQDENSTSSTAVSTSFSDLFKLANHYPSPHNGQPIRLKQTGTGQFEAYFDKSRGLQSSDISYIFSFVSMGVFIEHLALCAEALGYEFKYSLSLPKTDDLRGKGLIKFANLQLQPGASPNKRLAQTIKYRQTSRKKYFEGASPELTDRLFSIAASNHAQLKRLDKQRSKQAIWLNQRAVFDDMFDEPVRKELNHWLRYDQQQKQQKQDGLAYDCMELNGKLMKYIVDHHKLLRMPVLSQLIKQYYLRTMTDASDVFYMLAPFANEQNAFNAGLAIMKIWKAVAEAGYYLHPFGTIMSNHSAHQDFLNLAGVRAEPRDKSYLVFIFRCGKSEPPAASLRLPFNKHLVLE